MFHDTIVCDLGFLITSDHSSRIAVMEKATRDALAKWATKKATPRESIQLREKLRNNNPEIFRAFTWVTTFYR